MTSCLSGRTVLVTGAGRGLGRGVATAAARAGAHVVVTSRADNGRDTAAAIVDAGGAASWSRCDVTCGDQVREAIADALRRTGRLDGVVHNAFAPPTFDDADPTALAEVTRERWRHEAAVSLRGAYFCAREAFPPLAEVKGRLVLLTSAAGIEGNPTHPTYAACKGAVRAMAKSLAREWGPSGVTVNAVSPYAETPSFRDYWEANPGTRADSERLTALGYVGDPTTDVAPVFTYLLSAASHYVTGQTFQVDAGRFMSF